MKKCWIVLLTALLLCGCGKQGALETVMDSVETPMRPEPREVYVALPKDAAKETMNGEKGGNIYFCEDYILTLQTVPGGDLQKTFLETTGYLPEQLSVMHTEQPDYKCYRCVWTAAGEQGDQVGRCTILDDGSYHYILTAMAEAEKAGDLTAGAWEDIFSSFCFALPEEETNKGS